MLYPVRSRICCFLILQGRLQRNLPTAYREQQRARRVIRASDLSLGSDDWLDPRESPLPSDVNPLSTVARRHIVHALRAVRGNRSEAARLLDIDRSTLHRKIRSLGIEAAEWER